MGIDRQETNSSPISIASRINRLSKLLVLAEADDLPAMAEIHTEFTEIKYWADQAGQSRLARAVVATAELIERVILSEVPDPPAAMETINRVVTLLQGVVLNGQDPESVKFPDGLGLDRPADAALSAGASPDEPAEDTLDLSYELPQNVDNAIFAEFLMRQSNVLEDFERLTLTLEKDADAQSAAASIRRLLHNLKGESALLGLSAIERVCHATEEALEHQALSSLSDTLLAINDWLGQVYAAYAGKGPRPRSPEYILKMLTANAPIPAPAPAPAAPVAVPSFLEGDATLLTDFVHEAREHLDAADVCLLNLEGNAHDNENINALFRRVHTLKGVAGFLALEDIHALAHESESLLERVRRGDIVLAGGTIDVVFDAVDSLKRLVAAVQRSMSTGNPLAHDEDLAPLVARIQAAARGQVDPESVEIDPKTAGGRKLGDILVESGVATRESVELALNCQQAGPEVPKLGELLVREGQASARDVAQALRAQRISSTGQAVKIKETLKVDADRLDQLVERIGELVIAESMVSQASEVREMATGQLLRYLNQLDKITRELQEMGTSLRMVPLRSTFQKMARLVRDLARKSGKQVEFVMAGEDTELDKTVVDKIGDPLIHMIRNAVDHGLESSSAERVAAGKSPEGHIELRAYHKGGNIYIEVQDDGRGLNRKAIQAKAIERGLIRDGDVLSDREIYNLIFQPGFSTAKVVTDVSGRGVGMDVVKRSIDVLRGQVDIYSDPGKGTTFSIKLPLTLAIIDGMVIRIGSERYIIPTLTIIRSIRPNEGDIYSVLGRGEMLSLHGQMLPIFRLARLFGIEGGEQELKHSIVVIVEDEGRQLGLVIDELLGQQQIVIKSLGESLRGTPGISGGAIMPNGQVGLILDIGGLVRLAHMKDGLARLNSVPDVVNAVASKS